MNSLFRRYALHTFLEWFAQSLFFTFGSLLVYEKTQSVLWVLVFITSALIAGLLTQTLILPFLWHQVKQPMHRFMFVGMVLMIASFVGLYLFNDGLEVLIAIAIAKGVGYAAYWVPSNTFLFYGVGNSDTPGKHSFIISLYRLIATLIAAVAGVALHKGDSFLLLLPIGAAMLLLSLIPLQGLHISVPDRLSFAGFKKLSAGAVLANMTPDHEFRITILPLILLSLFGSFTASLWVTAIAMIGTAGASYITAQLKDKGNGWFGLVGILIGIAVWAGYSTASMPITFITLGVAAGVGTEILIINREARLSREVVNGEVLDCTLAVEITRWSGNLVGAMIFLVAYLITGDLPQALLVLGALFVLPIGLYGHGSIAKHLKEKGDRLIDNSCHNP